MQHSDLQLFTGVYPGQYPEVRSSLGFHTMELSMPIFKSETPKLKSDFKQFSQETGSILIYSNDDGNTVIKFVSRKEGIEWLIRYNVWVDGFNQFCDFVEVKINPKILGGDLDYITAATIGDMNFAIANFNSKSRRISPLLRTFDEYSFKRIDYCINFLLSELIPEGTYEQVIRIIKRSEIPPNFKEWVKYNEAAHRMKTKPGSFYLISDSVTINCYSKYMKFLEQSAKNEANGYPPISQETMNAARDIIRFEVQCKYHKIYALAEKAKKAGNNSINKYKYLLSPEICEYIVRDYYNRTIGKGNWFTLQEATKKVTGTCNRQKANRLISTLQEVSQCRSLAKAKAKYQGGDLAAFKRTLKDLHDIGINPVTIPGDWGIAHIPNLLYAYDSKLLDAYIRDYDRLTQSLKMVR